ncbi:MAG: hypothetical protein LBQ51_04160 [Desulfovibrio sp.]|jgi:hypothetical protein|nr:hypothetical protein [Desulfovibrio sp.]
MQPLSLFRPERGQRHLALTPPAPQAQAKFAFAVKRRRRRRNHDLPRLIVLSTAESVQLLPHRHSEPLGSLKAGSAERNFLVILNEAKRSEESILKNQKRWILRYAQNDKTKNVADYDQNQIALENSQL